MADLDTREWLLTNGLGSFASGTVSDVRTRSYHGWLFAATNPPSERTLLISHLEASLEVSGEVVALGTNFWRSGKIESAGYKLLRSFELNPVPKWVWSQDQWQLSRQLVMPYWLGTGDWGLGTGDRGLGTGDRGLGTGDRGLGTGDRGLGTGDRGLGTGDREKTFIQSSIPSTQYPVPNTQYPIPNPQFCHRILIQYRYDGADIGILRLRLLIGDRDFHHQQVASANLQFSQLLGEQQLCLQAIISRRFGTAWYLRWTQGEYQPDAVWYWNYELPEDRQRGLGAYEDLYSPGYLTVALQPGDTVTLEARVGFPDLRQSVLTDETFAQAVEAEQQRLGQIGSGGAGEQGSGGAGELGEMRENKQFPIPNSQFPIPNAPCPMPHAQFPIWQQLLKAGDQFIVYRAAMNSPSIIAGYHWFDERGRDSLIALPGLMLVPQRFDLAKGLLQTFGRYCSQGLIPDAFVDGDGEPFYNSIDTSLWWIESLGLYLEATQDWQFLAEQFSVVQQIHKAFFGGTRFNIQVDATDGLVSWDARGVALTWMDAVIDGQPITPRCGKPVEINALWYSALCWMSRWAAKLSELKLGDPVRLAKQARRYAQQAQQATVSLQKFWNPQLNYFYDTIELDDRRNSQIRPNAVLALSFHHCGFPEYQGRLILDLAVKRLLTPYGLRSLDQDDPEYMGKYEGNLEQRDRAYHQGSVWCWLIGPFIRAWQRFYPNQPLPFDWQPLINHFLADGCLGSISEIFDGDLPHTPRGAVAQAWSVAEVIRYMHEWGVGSRE